MTQNGMPIGTIHQKIGMIIKGRDDLQNHFVQVLLITVPQYNSQENLTKIIGTEEEQLKINTTHGGAQPNHCRRL